MDRLPFIRKAIIAEHSAAVSALWTAAAIIVPTGIRWLTDRGQSGLPFATYFPAVLLVTVFFGWRWGTATALLSAIISNRLLRAHPLLFYMSRQDTLIILMIAIACVIIIDAGAMLRRIVREQEEARIREDMLKRESLHRVKNMLVVVQSLASLSARHSPPDQFVDQFAGRLQALDRANTLLGMPDERSGDVRQLVKAAIEPFRKDDNFTLEGPACEISKAAFVPLSLALHELCTNASKHGALTRSEGRVTIEWAIPPGDGKILMRWTERGGPPVFQASRRGMGMLLLRPQSGLPAVEVRFDVAGLECELAIETDKTGDDPL